MVSMVGCQDINLLPKDQLADDLFWKTPADYMKAVNMLYNSMETFGVKDADSDISYGLNENAVSNGTLVAPNSDGAWNDRFADLRQCNKIIDKSNTYAGETAEIARYVAEARFFRAYTYWRLMKKFADVPIVESPLDVDDPALYAGRNPQKEVEDFILAELESIQADLPKKSELPSTEKGRITQGAALALKARVALYSGTWAKYHKHRDDYKQLLDQAINAAERVRASGQYQLFEGAGNQSYRQLFINPGDNASEGILDNRYDKDIRMHSTAFPTFWGWRDIPTKKMADQYLCKSTGLPIEMAGSGFQGYENMVDEFKDRDPRMTQTFLVPGTAYRNVEFGDAIVNPKFNIRPETRSGYKLWKFMGEIVGGGVGDDYYDYHIIRYAEVLLILAEATFEKDEMISNEVLDNTINVVRGRMGVEMPPLTNEFVSGKGLDMQTEIRRERTVELAFEGFRRDDLRRWKTAETELKTAIRGIKYKGTEYEELQVLNDGNPGLVDQEGFLIVEPVSSRSFVAPKHYYYSLPLDELFLNPNLSPNNPGW